MKSKDKHPDNVTVRTEGDDKMFQMHDLIFEKAEELGLNIMAFVSDKEAKKGCFFGVGDDHEGFYLSCLKFLRTHPSEKMVVAMQIAVKRYQEKQKDHV